MVFPVGVDSQVSGRAADESLSASAPVIGVAMPGRIMGYDVARAIAVIGMIIVNYHNIFLAGRSHHPRWFTGLAFFLQGRAAAIFVMLAGVGITLMSHKAILSGDAILSRRTRQELLKRSIVLFFIGLVFLNWWRSDILHFYGLFLSTGALLLFVSGRILWGLLTGCLVVAALLFTFFEASPTMMQTILPAHPVFELCDDLLISGQYPMFPWFVFLLTGMWLGRPEIISNRRLIQRIFRVSLLIFILTVVLDYGADTIMERFPGNDAESPLALLLLSVPFPISPLFAVSALAGSLVVIILCITLSSHALFTPPLSRLAALGKMSLTVYVGHIIIGLAVEHLAVSRLNPGKFQILAVVFTVLICMGVFWGANLWFRHYERGPLEWLLRRVSRFL